MPNSPKGSYRKECKISYTFRDLSVLIGLLTHEFDNLTRPIIPDKQRFLLMQNRIAARGTQGARTPICAYALG